MNTTPTFYDSRIEGLEGAPSPGHPNGPDLTIYRARAGGYRLAREEDAPLLVAAKTMLAAIQRLRVCPLCKESECDCRQAAAEAIKAATEEETR